MERKLASIRTIREILPIENADRIELAKVDGWQSVVKKGQFKVGEKVIYFECDSWLPIDSRYEFLRDRCYKKNELGEGMRLKTMKFKNTLTQGLIMPLSDYPEIMAIEDGNDYTELLNVKLYQVPIPASLSGKVKGVFPSYLRRTDQERIQNLPEYFSLYKDIDFEVSEKIDGTSFTCYLKDGEFGVCSRNLDLYEDENSVYWRIVNKYKLKEMLQCHRTLYMDKNIALQGEIIGEGIQGNPYKLRGLHFYLFNIYSIDDARYFDYLETARIVSELNECRLEGCEKINHVPILEVCKIFEKNFDIDTILKYVVGNSVLNKDCIREGIVCKGVVDNNVVSFKVINNDYLINEK